MKAKILFQEKYYYPTYFDNSFRDRKKTGDWSGVLLIKGFIIKQYKNGKRLITNTDAITFRGRNKSEMLNDLQNKISGMKELPAEADEDHNFVPKRIKKLLHD